MKTLLCGLALAAATYTPTPLYTVEKLDVTEPNCKEACAHVAVEYPRLLTGDVKVRERIQKRLQQELIRVTSGEKLAPNLSNAVETFFSEARKTREQGINLPWELQVKFDVHSHHPKLLSVIVSSYSFTGGAHGMPYTDYLNFNLASGELLTLNDVLLPGKMPALLKMAETSFRNSKEIPAGQSLDQAGFDFDKNRFHLSQAVAISSRGIELYYNVYEINSYAYGTTEVYLDSYELAPLLRPEWRKVITAGV